MYLRPRWLVQSNWSAKLEVTLMAPMSVQVSTKYGRPKRRPLPPEIKMKLVRRWTWLSPISDGKVTAHEDTNSETLSPSKSGSWRGRLIFTKGIWYRRFQMVLPTSNMKIYKVFFQKLLWWLFSPRKFLTDQSALQFLFMFWFLLRNWGISICLEFDEKM